MSRKLKDPDHLARKQDTVQHGKKTQGPVGTTFSTWNEVIDLDRYPITSLETKAGQKLLEECRKQLATWGASEMPNFVRPKALDALVQEGSRIEHRAYRNALVGNAYLDEGEPGESADHARNLKERTVLGVIANDEFPSTSLLRQIYEWEPVMLFVGAILELPKIYRYGDPMGALNLSVMVNGDYLRWHFDQSDFVTSLAIRMPERGGAFEFFPRLRSPGNPNFEKVRGVLHGNRKGVETLPNKPGSLVLFQGKYSLHRVTPIEGKTSRLMALFSYDEQPDRGGTDYLRMIRYGRTQVKKID